MTFDSLWDETSSDVKPKNKFYKGVTKPELEAKLEKPEQQEAKSNLSFDSLWEETKPIEKTVTQKAGRLATQAGLGYLSNRFLPYEMATLPIGSESFQKQDYLQQVGNEIEDLLTQKSFGNWTVKDEENLQNLYSQIKNPESVTPYLKTADISIRGLAEKATGFDLHPEGFLEKAANWYGFIKNPEKSAKELYNLGLKPKELVKAIMPTATETGRSVGAASLYELAEQGKFGPLGTLGAIIAGDIIGAGTGYFIKNPKKALAESVDFITGANSKKTITNEFIDLANDAGIQLDAGSITNSPFIQMIQARLVQSGLTGEALKNARKDLSQQVINKLKGILDNVGELRFENNFQAAEAIKEMLKTEENFLFRFADPNQPARSLEGRVTAQERPDYQNNLLNQISQNEFPNSYQAGETLKTVANDIKTPIKETIENNWNRFNQRVEILPVSPQTELANQISRFIENNRGSLLLGESAAEARVLNAAQELLNSMRTEGGEIGVSMRNLILTKRTLQDVADYEFGGSNFQSNYKGLVAQINQAIERTLQELAPELREQYELLNAEYSAYKDTFENKNIIELFEPKNENYNAILNKFVTNPDALRSLEDMFILTPRGQEVLRQVKRDAAERIISNPNISARELRNLAQTLGPEFEEPFQQFLIERQFAIENPRPIAQRQQPLGIETRIANPKQQPELTGQTRTIKEADVQVRKKLFNFLKDKSSDQIMKMMDSVENIRKLKRTLSLTPEGEKLFKELARYKLEELITKNIQNSVTEQIKLGKFSNLLSSSESQAIVKELVGKEAFDSLMRLQKVSGKLVESANKFFNASQSGTVATDVAMVSTAITGLLTGNMFLAGSVAGGVAGMRMLTNLLADPVFLKNLEKASKTTKMDKLKIIFEEMKPSIAKATLETRD